MPLPLIPIVLGGIALLSGGYGVKKGFDAKEDYDRADVLNNEATTIYDDACEKLKVARDGAKYALKNLGETKFQVYKNSIIPFVEFFSKIKAIDFQDKMIADELKEMAISSDDLREITRVALKMQEVVGGGIAALGAGGLAGLAAYGGVGTLATASTGTAIASLGGVAATNATLAWLGGGALSAGGLGVAGGTAVLGGIVAGPVLAIGGMMLAAKAEEAKHNAYANRDKARMAAQQMKTAEVATNGIQKRLAEIDQLLLKLDRIFQPLLGGLRWLVASGRCDYSEYSLPDRKGVMMAALLAKTLKVVLETPILDKDGALTSASRRVLADTDREINKINQM
ncbi:hypothetical protein [Solidesulfovibrio carbinolicus]|uniref:hypothetical protein n=1 Tax=Solidesulfovibrio carbinolicus TaxID=296842 RepID=UPI001011F403|nr:hypothetical protein [Solidesulfovibrio carbinolicus]